MYILCLFVLGGFLHFADISSTYHLPFNFCVFVFLQGLASIQPLVHAREAAYGPWHLISSAVCQMLLGRNHFWQPVETVETKNGAKVAKKGVTLDPNTKIVSSGECVRFNPKGIVLDIRGEFFVGKPGRSEFAFDIRTR